LEKGVETAMGDRMKLNLRCATCGKPLLVDRGGDKRVLRTRIIIFDNGTSLAKCPSCKAEVVVPIKLVGEFLNTPTAPGVGGSSKLERRDMGLALDKLARDLVTLCGPLAARVRTMIGSEGGRTTKAQLEELRGCKVHIHQIEKLIDHMLSGCDSSEAITKDRTSDQC
jgi:ribosomal protein S27E